MNIRTFKKSDATEVSDLVRTTLRISNSKDYTQEYIKDAIASHSPEEIATYNDDTHMYVVCDGDKIVGCGGITGYWGSLTESFLKTIFVLPEYQDKGIGRMIIDTLEADDYYKRAWRTEVAASLTAVGFYEHLGYTFKGTNHTPDEFGTIRMEKIKKISKTIYNKKA